MTSLQVQAEFPDWTIRLARVWEAWRPSGSCGSGHILCAFTLEQLRRKLLLLDNERAAAGYGDY